MKKLVLLSVMMVMGLRVLLGCQPQSSVDELNQDIQAMNDLVEVLEKQFLPAFNQMIEEEFADISQLNLTTGTDAYVTRKWHDLSSEELLFLFQLVECRYKITAYWSPRFVEITEKWSDIYHQLLKCHQLIKRDKVLWLPQYYECVNKIVFVISFICPDCLRHSRVLFYWSALHAILLIESYLSTIVSYMQNVDYFDSVPGIMAGLCEKLGAPLYPAISDPAFLQCIDQQPLQARTTEQHPTLE
jgi:hypothetical protein